MRGAGWWVVGMTGCGVVAGVDLSGPAPGRDAPAPTETSFNLILSDAAGPTEVGAPPAPATRLPSTKALTDRLPPLPAAATAPAALRPGPKPPPITGTDRLAPFPPEGSAYAPVAPAAGPAGALHVTRRAPEGEIGVGASVTVSFDAPMVPVASVDAVSAVAPVQISPQPPGSWRWLGTRTAMFQAEGRLPAATVFTATLPAGTRAANGAALAAAESWTFSTPPVTLQSSWPSASETIGVSPVFILRFDQRVSPEAVLAHATLKAGRAQVPLALASDAEVLESAGSWMWREAPARTAVALKPSRSLTPDTAISLTLDASLPSAEGPRLPGKDQRLEFRTYGPLKVTGARCGWEKCWPDEPMIVELSNPIDPSSLRDLKVHVAPEPRGANLQIWGNQIAVLGSKDGNRKYTVTIPAGVRDTYGQELGKPYTATFTTAPADPALIAPGDELLVLDPDRAPEVKVYAINQPNLKLKVWRVDPTRLSALVQWMNNERWSDKPAAPPAEKIADRLVNVDGEADLLTEVRVDLSEYLDNGKGQLLVEIEPAAGERHQRIFRWVQATRLGLTAWGDNAQALVQVSDLGNGAPTSKVEVALEPAGTRGLTDPDGVVSLDLGQQSGAWIIARKDDDLAILPVSGGLWEGGWSIQPYEDERRWLIFDDRGLYKPGETVSVKGFVRTWQHGPDGDLRATGDRRARWTMMSPTGRELGKGEATISAVGSFHFTAALPKDVDLGWAHIQIDADGGSTAHSFQIQEFRRPEFEVSLSPEPGPYTLGGATTITMRASYFAGGGLPGAPARWTASASPATFSPPGRDGWHFGPWSPPWLFRGWPSEPGWGRDTGTTWQLEGRTDPSGAHVLGLGFPGADVGEAYSISLSGSVEDANRQVWEAATSLLVHPALAYVGVQGPSFVEAGKPFDVKLLAVDLDGGALAGRPIAVTVTRTAWEQTTTGWEETKHPAGRCEVASKGDAVSCTFTAEEGGSHEITAEVVDAQGRKSRSTLITWVAGGKVAADPSIRPDQLVLTPEAGGTYAPGQTARIHVRAPFSPARGVVTWIRDGILAEQAINLADGTGIIEVPITEAMLPNLWVQVDVQGRAGEGDTARPAFAKGNLQLKVSTASRTLTVAATPVDKETTPGAKTLVDVVITDHTGAPVRDAEVALIVVDEAVLALAGWDTPDPIAMFYQEIGASADSIHLRQWLRAPEAPTDLGEGGLGAVGSGRGGGGRMMYKNQRGPMPEMAAAMAPMPAPPMEAMATADGDARSPSGPPVALRTDFAALAAFSPALRTDSQGKARLEVKLPDNLTRYRVVAVAAAGDKAFGRGESAITARKPLMVRPSAPRFLNVGDRFELPIVVQNQTGAPLTVDVALRSSNLALFDTFANTTGKGGNAEGRRVTIPAHDRVEVRFPAAAIAAGDVIGQVIAVSGSATDAAELRLPVWTPASTEAFATYGELDAALAAQPLTLPSDVLPGYGTVELTTSSTALSALTDAVVQIYDYPYGCAEQVSSRVLSMAALRDVLDAFGATGLPDAETRNAAMTADLKRLAELQNDDGGFGWWRRGEESWPYVTLHVAHALQVASEKGWEIPDSVWGPLDAYLRRMPAQVPAWYGPTDRAALHALSLWIRERRGEKVGAEAAKIWRDHGEKLPLDALGWLLPVLDAGGQADEAVAIERVIANRVTETASTAAFVTGTAEDTGWTLLRSDRRTDGVLLDALLRVDPKNELIPKVVRGLLGHRVAGHWGSTQENAWVLVALDRYFRAAEGVTPNFVARAWLGQDFAGELTFRGRSTERQHVNVPLDALASGPRTRDLLLEKKGTGRLYWRLGLRYAPADLDYAPIERGFEVSRTYSGVDNPSDVTRGEDGVWRVKLGARVAVKVQMITPARRYHVALVDPTPAGLEAINPALQGSQAVPMDPTPGPWRWGGWRWYSHDALRDERAEAFAPLLWDGVWTYEYSARATTPGAFVVPPPRAEEMYAPEVFGRGASDRMIVE